MKALPEIVTISKKKKKERFWCFEEPPKTNQITPSNIGSSATLLLSSEPHEQLITSLNISLIWAWSSTT